MDSFPPPVLCRLLNHINARSPVTATKEQQLGRDGSGDPPSALKKYDGIYEYSRKIINPPTPPNTDQVLSLFLPTHHHRLISCNAHFKDHVKCFSNTTYTEKDIYIKCFLVFQMSEKGSMHLDELLWMHQPVFYHRSFYTFAATG